MQVLSTLEELDAKLAECQTAARTSDDALRQVFSTFRMNISAQLPADPFSAEYRTYQMDLYQRLAGTTYDVSNERSKFDVAAAVLRPFPYFTGSLDTVGRFTMGVGALLHAMRLSPGVRVLEFGAGWGNTTIAMAMAGLNVTALDIESDFCDLLTSRARQHGLDIAIVNDDFMWAETVAEPFDAAVFFECFHHCADHMRLLRALQRAIRPGGRIYFGAEPIVERFPVPWGLRLDGESLWAIRNNKWLELGFKESYFREALKRTGWTATKHIVPGLRWAAVWEAMRPHETDAAFEAARAAEASVLRPLLRMAASELQSALVRFRHR